MGNTTGRSLTHKQLYDDTENTRRIMNTILEYMLKQITVRDFVALSNPNECKKYVLFMANQLHRHFYEIKVTPEKGEKDHIMFRSIKDVVTPDSRMDTEKQSLCVSIAYFYTRIFQIYGALAITLMDDISIATRFDKQSVIKGISRGNRVVTPGTAPIYMQGGGPSDRVSLGHFEFLRSYLHDEYQEPYGFSTRYPESKAYIYFKKDAENRNELGQPIPTSGFTPDTVYQHGKFSIGYSGISKYTYIPLIAHNVLPADVKCQIRTIQYVKKGSSQYVTLDIPSNILTTRTLTITPVRDPVSGVRTFEIKEAKGVSVNDFFNQLFDKLVPFIKSITDTDLDPSDVTVSVKDLLSPGYKTEKDISPQFSIERTIQNLQNVKPLGHCIARALQLLKTIPLGNEPGYSSVCKAHFLELHTRTKEGTTITYSRSGIPLPNDDLDQSPGMSALAELFYDTISIGTPRLEINKQRVGKNKSSLDEYKEFMKTMAILFGNYRNPDQSVRSEDELATSGLKGIKNRRDPALCHSKINPQKPIKEDIPLTPLQARNVYSSVTELFQIQLKHAANCGKIINMLFTIKKEKDTGYTSIQLNDRVIKGGIPEVDAINRVARSVLVDYYSKCESTYLKGMQKVITYYHNEEEEKSIATAASAAASSAASAPVASPIKMVPGSAATAAKPAVQKVDLKPVNVPKPLPQTPALIGSQPVTATAGVKPSSGTKTVQFK